jgi:hypothetical protein
VLQTLVRELPRNAPASGVGDVERPKRTQRGAERLLHASVEPRKYVVAEIERVGASHEDGLGSTLRLHGRHDRIEACQKLRCLRCREKVVIADKRQKRQLHSKQRPRT